jgi:UDP-N-acetylglucosamine 1-carboxyvinyltransferase
MGADVRVTDKTAVLTGVSALHGAAFEVTDLRGGAAMAVAALAAEGVTDLRALEHLDRGYEHFAETFHSLGGDVRRCRFSAKERENQSLGA